MIRPRSLLVLRLACIVAIAVSMALLLDSLAPAPSFCVTGSGCDSIRQTYGKIAGIPVSALGLSAFGGLFFLTFSHELRWLTARAAIFGGFIGLGLLAFQAFAIQTFCKLCVIVDLSSMVAAGAGFLLLKSEGTETRDRGRLGWVGALIAAAGLPWALVQLAPPGAVPRQVRSVWEPGVVNVVEFSDFECPYCRKAHPSIEAAIKAVPDVKVHLVRRTLPLTLHPHARDASRAWLCADSLGKGDAMADRLFTGELTTEAINEHARVVGLDPAAFQRCLAGKEIDETLEKHIAFVRSSDFKGLPTVWVNDRRLLGASEPQVYVDAIRDAAAGSSGAGGKTWPIALVLVLSLGFIGLGVQSARSSSAA